MNLSVDVRIELHRKRMALVVVRGFALAEDCSVWCHIGKVPVLIGNLLAGNVGSVFFCHAHFIILLLSLDIVLA